MPSGLLLFCTFLFSTFRYENAKQIICIFIYCLCFSAIAYNSHIKIIRNIQIVDQTNNKKYF